MNFACVLNLLRNALSQVVGFLDQTEIMGIIAFVGLGLCMANILYDGYIIYNDTQVH